MSASSPPFDPRTVPIWDAATADIHQQRAVAPQQLTPAALQQRFAQPRTWQPEPRHEIVPQPQALREAAVLIGLQASNDPALPLQVLFTQRSQHLEAHPGQIAFPGGKIDALDAHAVAAALREAHEEVGLPPTHATVLGTLQPYATGTGFRVTPVVALLPPDVALTANPSEVTEVFHVPLSFLMNPAHHRKHFWQPSPDHRREWFSMPFADPASTRERFIWGVTAGILRDFYRFLSA